jgi:hypothetical protein
MGFDESRGMVVCDLYGCWNEIPVPPGDHPVDHVAAHPDWQQKRGLYRCPEHPFSPNPW